MYLFYSQKVPHWNTFCFQLYFGWRACFWHSRMLTTFWNVGSYIYIYLYSFSPPSLSLPPSSPSPPVIYKTGVHTLSSASLPWISSYVIWNNSSLLSEPGSKPIKFKNPGKINCLTIPTLAFAMYLLYVSKWMKWYIFWSTEVEY